MARRLSYERKAAYYVGLTLIVLGLLVFLGNMLAMFGGGPPDPLAAEGGPPRVLVPRLAIAFLGMGLMVAGSIVRRIGARGLAGSGVLLDPERARQELEPYARMAGGLARDALDEAGLAPGTRPVVVLECPACRRRNEADARFCQGCGQALRAG